MAEHILTNSRIILNQQLMNLMIDQEQVGLMNLCLKYKAEYDVKIKSDWITLSGYFMEESLDNKILLSDFINLMLEKKFVFPQIKWYILDLKDFLNFWELFVLFAVKRQVILMSYLLNSDDFTYKFEPYLLADVLANDVYDIALLIYWEYFLQMTP